ncbi:YqgQ family protein [Vagococcus hydrophili]|uniref:YqgQ family protein n=1 Tax=Vagococcus hydrophili TaxID=2714947 RepID=A0A6G8AX73_9ENTE|nr:YqgQ family protein [Vagococcus hydrophili]QIL49562.1 YqgQ family protein [Vagococcus hydrophili]
MRTMYDVQQLLKRFGAYIYVGNRLWDIELMMIELKKIYDNELIERNDYINAMMILKREHRLETDYQEGLQ